MYHERSLNFWQTISFSIFIELWPALNVDKKKALLNLFDV